MAKLAGLFCVSLLFAFLMFWGIECGGSKDMATVVRILTAANFATLLSLFLASHLS